MKRFFHILLFSFLVMPVSAVTVHDPLNFIMNYLTQIQTFVSNANEEVANQAQIKELRLAYEQYKQLQAQYQEMIYIKDSLEGRYTYGEYTYGPFKIDDPRLAPSSISSYDRQISQGGDNSDFGKSVNHYKQRYGTPSLNKSHRHKEGTPTGNAYIDARNNSLGVIAEADKFYDTIEGRRKAIQSLSKQIDKTDNVKQSLDLNNAMMAELSTLMTDYTRFMVMNARAQNIQHQYEMNKDADRGTFNR